MNKKHVTLFADGASRGNPGAASIGVVICDDDGHVIKEISETLGHATNNIAEYTALLKGLSACADMKISSVTVYMDSELVIRQLNGIYKVKNEALLVLYEKILKLKQQFSLIKFFHVPREKNKKADALANKALDKK